MKVKVVLLPGDGIGLEVMAEGLKVLKAVMFKQDLDLEVRQFSSGWRYFSEHGTLWEDGAFEACRDWADATLHGATGWPGVRPKDWTIADGSVVMDLRFGLDLFANVRPVKLLKGVPIILGGRVVRPWREKEVDLVIVRENLEGLYSSVMKHQDQIVDPDVRIDKRPISKAGSLRVIRYAFMEADNRCGRQDPGADPPQNRPSVTCVDKSNALPSCALFRQMFEDIVRQNPNVKSYYYYADAFQPKLLQDPSRFDVVVTTNLIGDLVTDLAALLQGGLGMAPSGNIGKEKAMFEPVHGSAPDIAGKGVANPTGMILSIKMMLDWLAGKKEDKGLFEAGRIVDEAVSRHYLETDLRTPDLGGDMSTNDIGDSIVSALR